MARRRPFAWDSGDSRILFKSLRNQRSGFGGETPERVDLGQSAGSLAMSVRERCDHPQMPQGCGAGAAHRPEGYSRSIGNDDCRYAQKEKCRRRLKYIALLCCDVPNKLRPMLSAVPQQRGAPALLARCMRNTAPPPRIDRSRLPRRSRSRRSNQSPLLVSAEVSANGSTELGISVGPPPPRRPQGISVLPSNLLQNYFEGLRAQH